MNKKCWFCKHFYERCTDCVGKSKFELWEGNENGDTRNNSSIRGVKENFGSINNTTSKLK